MQDKTFAEWVALNQITTVRIALQQGQIPPTGTSNGDIDLANRTWHWRQDVVASQVPGINRIDVKVRPKEVKGGDDDNWYVTVSGLAGNAMGMPGSSAAMMNWDPALGTAPGDQGSNSTHLGNPNPGAPGNPTGGPNPGLPGNGGNPNPGQPGRPITN